MHVWVIWDNFNSDEPDSNSSLVSLQCVEPLAFESIQYINIKIFVVDFCFFCIGMFYCLCFLDHVCPE